MAGALIAGFWGLVGGSALVLGALVGWFAPLPQRLIAAVMASGAGVLISAVAFELMDEARAQGGVAAAAGGFLGGAAVYTVANVAVSRRGARHRKRSGLTEGREQAGAGTDTGLALAVGALLDGVPESVVIGVGLLDGGSVGAVTVAAVFLSNVPEGLSSAAGMRRAGRSAGYVFGVWGGIALASGLAALTGYVALAGAPPTLVAGVTAFAAGAILAMLVDTMIPEATEHGHEASGLIAATGFLAAFALSRMAS